MMAYDNGVAPPQTATDDDDNPRRNKGNCRIGKRASDYSGKNSRAPASLPSS